MSAFASAIASGLNAVRAAAGETVLYCRGEQSVSVVAVPGLSNFDRYEANEMPVASQTRDWIFQSNELVIDGDVITPQRGDLIRKTVGEVTTTFELMNDGSQVYRYCDSGRTRIRVHTKEAGAS